MRPQVSNSWDPRRVSGDDQTRVLLVEESFEDLQYYTGLLQGAGCLVRTCGSYSEGINRLDSESFDIVVVGQGTPRFEGRSVLEHAKSMDRHLPVLVLAPCLEMNCYLDAMQLGAEDYLAEPLPVSEVAEAVKRHVRPRRHGASATAGTA